MTAGEGVSDAELAGMGITLSKQPVKADFNVLQNTLTAGQDLATLTLNTAADGKTASAIILPQEGASGRSLELTNGRHCIDMAGGSRPYLRAR